MSDNRFLSDEEYDRTVCVNCGQRFPSLSEHFMCPECEVAYYPNRPKEES